MRTIKKGASKAPKVVEEDPFFLNLPTPEMRIKMQNAVDSFWVQMKAQGTLAKTTKDKSQIISTIAEYFK